MARWRTCCAARLAAQPEQARLRVLRFVGAAPAEGLALVPALDADRCDVVIGAATQADIGRRARPLAGDRRARLSNRRSGSRTAHLSWRRLRHRRARRGRLPTRRTRRVDSRTHDACCSTTAGWCCSSSTPRAPPIWYSAWPALVAWALDVATDATVRRDSARAGGLARAAGAGRLRDEIEACTMYRRRPTGPYVLIAQAERTRRVAVPLRCGAGSRTWLIVRDADWLLGRSRAALAPGSRRAGQRIVTVISRRIYERIDARSAMRSIRPTRRTGNGCSSQLRRSGARTARLDPSGGPRSRDGLERRSRHASPHRSRAPPSSRPGCSTCARRAIRPECWVIAAHAGTALLPPPLAIRHVGSAAGRPATRCGAVGHRAGGDARVHRSADPLARSA
jgi:hypothetical protein